jgi:hypothetical protein
MGHSCRCLGPQPSQVPGHSSAEVAESCRDLLSVTAALWFAVSLVLAQAWRTQLFPVAQSVAQAHKPYHVFLTQLLIPLN